MINLKFLGIILSFLAVIFGVVSGIFVKILSIDLQLITILSYRFLFSLPLIYLFAFKKRHANWLDIKNKRVLIIRIFVGLGGIYFWFLSLKYIPLGQATSIFISSVLFVTILSPFLLKEKVGFYRWSAVIIGLLGVIIITDPFSENVDLKIIFPVLGSFCGAGLYITLRKLGKTDEPESVACWYNSIGFIITTLALLFSTRDILEFDQIFLLILLGISASIVQLCLTSSYKYSEAVVVSTIRYFQIPMSVIVGYIMFLEKLFFIQIFGISLIFISCLIIVWREYKKK